MNSAPPTIRVSINREAYTLALGACVADAADAIQAIAPFAAAVNLQFVPKTRYADTVLQEGDQLEFIRPVTGG